MILNFSRSSCPPADDSHVPATGTRREVRVGDYIPESLKTIRPFLGEGVGTEFTAAPRLPAILVNTAQLEEALLNLALHATDAMPESGTLFIRAELRSWDEDDLYIPGWALPGRWVRLTVRDSGRETDEDNRMRSSAPFSLVKTGERGPATGLDLAHTVARSHGGFLRVLTAPGRGSGAEIYLPAPAPAEGSAAPPSTILLAEDDPSELQLGTRILRGAGHEVIPAGNGLEALAAFGKNREAIDLVILDALMPELTGFGVAERIREIAPDMPILFCSGYSGLEDLSEETLPPGCSVIYKPYSLERLVRVVSDHLGEGAPSV